MTPLLLPTPEDAARLGAAIAARLRPGEAVCLHGPLGAGKSTLARGLVRALTSPEEEAPSPTWTLVQTYEGRDFPVAHLDLYRLRRPDQADELGIDDALETGCVVIEWPERLGEALPPDRLCVMLSIEDGKESGAASGRRLARLEGFGSWTERVRDLPSAFAALS